MPRSKKTKARTGKGRRVVPRRRNAIPLKPAAPVQTAHVQTAPAIPPTTSSDTQAVPRTTLDVVADLEARHARVLTLVHSFMIGLGELVLNGAKLRPSLASLARAGGPDGLTEADRLKRARVLLKEWHQLNAALRIDVVVNLLLTHAIGPVPGPDAPEGEFTKRALRKINWTVAELLRPMLQGTDDDSMALDALLRDTKAAFTGHDPRTIAPQGTRPPRQRDFTQESDGDVAVCLAHFIGGRMGFDGENAGGKVLAAIGYGLSPAGFRHLEKRLAKAAKARMRQAGALSLSGSGLPLADLAALTLPEQKTLAIQEFFRDGDDAGPDPLNPADPKWTEQLCDWLRRLLDRARGVG
jgi:hypothetical protein